MPRLNKRGTAGKFRKGTKNGWFEKQNDIFWENRTKSVLFFCPQASDFQMTIQLVTIWMYKGCNVLTEEDVSFLCSKTSKSEAEVREWFR